MSARTILLPSKFDGVRKFPVEALTTLRKPLAITSAIDLEGLPVEREYVITHVATGCRVVGAFPSVSAARRVLAALLAIDGWSRPFQEIHLDTAFRDRVYEAVTAAECKGHS